MGIASGNLVSLSEQQFVDCDKVDSGCSGGLMDNGFNFAKSNALCTEESYPYKAKGGTCAASSCTVGLAKGAVTGYKDVSADSESAMMSAVSQQPVSIAIEADRSIFQLYKSGVLSGLCGANLDHGVLAVGYGTEDGKDYWKVKNSWGASWGDNGYIKLLRGKGGAGECGLLKSASYPVVTTSTKTVDYSKLWNDFKVANGKTYSSAVEEEQRFEIFKVNVDYISSMNAKNKFRLGVTPFADMTADEFGASHFGIAKPDASWGSLPNLGEHTYNDETLAESVGWTTKGAVTPVKNQGQCGSCWSFSTTGSLEGAWKLAGNSLTSLSEQQFVDCDKVDQGCNGGLMDHAFQFAEKNAICTESSYPYKGRGGTCEASSCTVGIPNGDVKGYKDVTSDSEQALMSAVQQQPVSIAIEADKMAFQSYKSGILSSTCGSNLDHGVLLVGYGTDGGKDYWKVKNSWGTTYGENGYVRLLRGKGGSGPAPGPPSPPTPPAPPSPPSPSGSTHYEKPPCRSDEVDVTIQGFDGETCTPKCTNNACPTDVPEGTTATPQCVLQDSSSGDKYCALTCLIGGCPPGASCKRSGLTGLCLYPQSNANVKELEVADSDLISV